VRLEPAGKARVRLAGKVNPFMHPRHVPTAPIPILRGLARCETRKNFFQFASLQAG